MRDVLAVMPPEIGEYAWLLAGLVCKLLVYLAVAAAIGGIGGKLWRETESRPWLLRGRIAALAVGLPAVAAHFFVQVATFAGNGLAGLLDTFVMQLMWDSQVGTQTLLRACGFSLALAHSLVLLGKPGVMKRTAGRIVSAMASLSIAGLLAYSFTLTGHSANLGWLGAVAIGLHVLAVFWWLGSLYPLWKVCRERSPAGIFEAMDNFGRLAIPFVATVILAGTVLAYQLLGSPGELVSTPYGRALALKLLLVMALLLYAARHKWQLTPCLLNGSSPARLRHSIAWEGVVACLILLLTAVLSTLLGPAVFSSL